jgi:hypothetical protein
MNKLRSNKYVVAAAYILSIMLCVFGVFYGFTMADPGTGSFAGVNFSPNQVTITGLSIGTICIVIRSLIGPNFREYEMPRPLIILWCVLFFVGALIFSTLRMPDERRVSSGTSIFISGALLPLLLYGGLGIAVNKAGRRK